MRVFVLCTGRCGSTTFTRACSHMTNYSAKHESRSAQVTNRLRYPDDHIEVDNRLSWFLGSLDRLYGDDPVYVHLTRDPEETAKSYAERFTGSASIVKAFGFGILRTNGQYDQLDVSRLIVQTITDNIEAFLRDKTKVVRASLPDLRPGFDDLWNLIGARGNRSAAHRELTIRHNARRGGPRARR